MNRVIGGLWLLLLGVLGLHAEEAAAQTSGVICIPGATGETQLAKNVGCIDVLAWSWGATNIVSFGSGGVTAGKSQFIDFQFTKPVDSASEDLFRLVVSGTPAVTGSNTIEYREFLSCGACSSTEPYLIIRLSEVYVTSLSPAGAEGQDISLENVVLAPGEVEYCYRPTDQTGQLGPAQCRAWSVLTNSQPAPL